MTTSSSDATRAEARGPSILAGLRARLTFATPGVRSRLPVRVVDRSPPPPPVAPVDVAPLARALEAGFAAARARDEATFAEIERGCVELALAAAERVVRRRCERGELELEEPLRALIGSRRRELEEQAAVLRLHPADARALQEKLAELTPAGARVELLADAAQPRGSLSLEFGAARVTRTLVHELTRLRAELLAESG
jgi:flagellar biosynthesis/type III secretory pathway protein FliH